MAANANWPRWIFASIADCLSQLAVTNSLPVFVEGADDRTDAFMQASDRVEVHITQSSIQEISKGYHRVYVDVNVLLASRYDGANKNAYGIQKYAGAFYEVLSGPISVYNYGNEAGDYVDGDPSTRVLLGCLTPVGVARITNFGQVDRTDKLKETLVDARLVVHLED